MNIIKAAGAKKLFLLLLTVLPLSSLNAQTVNTAQTATNLANALVGTGVTVSGATLNCPAGASGTYTGGLAPLNIPGGIVLTSGSASVVGNPATYFSSENNGTGGDADLNTYSGFTTFDACVLEFDFSVAGNAVEFQYQFGSEEYPGFSCSSFNDVFAFLISGGTQYLTPTNIALLPGNIPVTINTTTNHTGQTCNTNTGFYIDNEGSTNPPVYDGLTTVLTAHADVTSGTTYHLKLGIADASDHVLTSGVFIQQGSLTVAPPSDPYFGCHCPIPDSMHKVKIAHKTTGKKIGCQSICVDTSAVAAHLAHGDIICATCPGTGGARVMLATPDDIVIAPNPNSGSFTITLPDLQTSVSIRVTDLMGKTIVNRTETDTQEVQIDLKNNIKGVYFVEVKAGTKTFKSKVVVE